MHLKKISLRNFRCFEQLDLQLHPRLTVLVAENGGGKTAVLDGIAIGLSPVLRYLSSASQRLSGPGIQDIDFRIESLGKNDRVQLADVTQVCVETTRGLRWDHWRAATKGKKPEDKIGQKELSDYAIKILDSLKTDQPDLFPIFTYYGVERGRLPVPQRLRGTKIDYSQPVAALIGALEPHNDFKEMLNWFDLEETTELRINKGRPPEEYEETEMLAAVRRVLEFLLGGMYENPHFNPQHKFVVETTTGPGQLQVSQLSQGYQSMLAMGMDFSRRLVLANRHLDHETVFQVPEVIQFVEHWKQEQETPEFVSPTLLAPAIMLVDEIDLHLHPSWQQRVLQDLMRAFPCTQFVVTTHSPQVLTTLTKENIRLLEQDEDGTWQAKEPDFSPLAHEAGDALAAIMDTHPKPEIGNITNNIHAYEQLARAGKADSSEGRRLKALLENAGYEFTAADTALYQHLARKAKKGQDDT